MDEHQHRVKLAGQCLPQPPPEDYGITRMIKEARQATAVGLDAGVL